MKHTILLILFCVFFMPLEAKDYTLEQLVAIGYRNSAELKQIRKEVEKVSAQIDEAYGRAMPQLSFSANFQYAPNSFNAMTAGLGGDTPSFSDILEGQRDQQQVPVEPGDLALSEILDQTLSQLSSMEPPKYSANASITLQQPVFAQGKVSTGLKISKMAQRSLVCKLQDAEQRIKADVTRLFYNAMLARENVTMQNETMGIARESHRLAVVRQALGSGSELDTLSSQLSMQQIQIDYENAQSDHRLALEALVEGTGIEELPDSVALIGSFPDAGFDIELDEALARMEENNKKLGQLHSGEQIQEYLLTMSKTDFLPSVFVGGSLSKIALFDWGDQVQWHDDQKVFAGLQMDLFTGVQRINRVRQARADLERFRINHQDVISQLQLGVKSAHKKMQLARRQVRQTKAMIVLAEKGREIAKKSYEIGKSTLVELQNAELQLKQARMGHNAARLDFYMAVVDLRLLMGDFNVESR